jgi:putative phage-type endonuclease
MIALDIPQRSAEWYEARLGIPTGSDFGRIMTAGLKPSTQAEVYQNKLVAEWYTGEPEENYVNEAMQRGIDLEPDGIAAYEFATDKEVEPVGFIYMDEDKLVGVSPDGLCGSHGVELKCPLPSTHVSYLLADGLPAAYTGQVQGSMYVTGLEKWDFVSYCPGFPPLIITVDRDEKWQSAFRPLIEGFIEGMLAKREKLINLLGEKI